MPPKRKWFCRLWLSSYPYLTDTYTCFSWCLSTALSSPPPLIAHLLVSPPHYAWKQNKSCDRPYGCANLDCLCNLKRLQVLFHVPVMTRTSTKSNMLKINKQKRKSESAAYGHHLYCIFTLINLTHHNKRLLYMDQTWLHYCFDTIFEFSDNS